LARSHTAEHRLVTRAKALLLAAAGMANTQIAEAVGLFAPTVRSWRSAFAEDGLSEFGQVAAGRGRKPTIPAEVIEQIVCLTQGETPEGQTHWSCRTMAKRVGVSPATGQRVCR